MRETLAGRKARYAQGFREWMLLRQQDEDLGSSIDAFDVENLGPLPLHPYFPLGLELELWGKTLYAVGCSKWRTGCNSQDIPEFTKKFRLAISVQRPTSIQFESSACTFPKWFGNDGGHLGVLVLAWAYILSARWAEIMPGAGICYTAPYERVQGISEDPKFKKVFTLTTGTNNVGALHWWKALVGPGRRWSATISKSGQTSISPWSTLISMPEDLDVRVTGIEGSDEDVTAEQSLSAPSSDQAMQFLTEYCEYHSIQNQCAAALSAALVLPLARSSRRSVRLPVPQSSARRSSWGLSSKPSVLSQEQLDKLLTLSCNCEGIEAILSSCFLNPDVPGNVCSDYLQGIFAVIDATHDIQDRTSLLMRGLGHMGFLWLGAGIAGLQDGLLRLFRDRTADPELHSAAWTQTLQSFIQQPVLGIQNGRVARADECKLLFLTQAKWHTNPPLSAWPLFGTTELKDVNLEVEEHIRCGSHCLFYDSWTWSCRDKNNPVSHRPSPSIPRLHSAQRVIDATIPVSYHAFDPEEESASENTTMNNFSWLRGTDGYPVAERDIRNHEWLREDTDN
ncbi:hypothetical protein INS49_003647 [Diaporthe citri]|uniref:uncharacterized protein n=1 Tax=Diaporthe citri TaxID=83186 RepID=UPI001C82329C|nr:uncharacterized protein INS49_003647 [Diaporthe citri]KAG6355683.1 hypothetical protein INS49_003647 [Diaporthe citri]